MIGLFVSFIVALVVLYKLYSTIGFHNEDDKGRSIKSIDAREVPHEAKELSPIDQFQLQRDQELESRIYRELDESSKESLNKILQIVPTFSLSWVIKRSDYFFTKIFEVLQLGKIENIEEWQHCSNDVTLEKIKNLIKDQYNKVNKVLVCISQIAIKKISLDASNNVAIEIEISSDQMMPHHQYTTQFVQQSCKSSLIIGACDIVNSKDSKWIVLDFDKI